MTVIETCLISKYLVNKVTFSSVLEIISVSRLELFVRDMQVVTHEMRQDDPRRPMIPCAKSYKVYQPSYKCSLITHMS